MHKEKELIFLVSRVRLDEKELSQIRTLLKNDLDWNYIFEVSKKEMTSCLIYHHLDIYGLKDYIPIYILGELRQIYYANFTRNMLIREEMKKLLEIFNTEKIRTILLKGFFLAEKIYKNLALRPMTDIDILIKKEDFPKVNEILSSLGYSSIINSYHILDNPFLYSATFSCQNHRVMDSFSIDLHWHILSSTWLMGFLSDGIDMRRIWEQAEPIKIDNVDVLTLSPAHLLIFLSLHGFSHNFERIILLTDILETIIYHEDKLEWNKVKEEAQRLEVENILSYALYFTFQKLGYEPDKIQKFNLFKGGFEKRAIKFLINNNGKMSFYGLPCLIYILTKNNLRDRLRLTGKGLRLLAHLINRNLNPSSEG